MRLAILLVCLSSILGCSRASNCDSLLDSIRDELQNTNPQISDIQVLDTKPRLSQYWVVARGINPAVDTEHLLDDELFGLFVVDASLARIEHTVDVFPTPRWRDYDVWIASYSPEQVTLRGRGSTYHDNALRKIYQVPP